MAVKKFPIQQNLLLGILVLAVVAGAFWVGKLTTELKLLKTEQSKTGQQPEVAVAEKLSEAEWQEISKAAVAIQGEENAAVTIVEFIDYQCPFCQRAFEQTYPELQKQYVQTGKARYLVRDLPLSFHPNAKPAALAARCAGEQGKYWQMHDRLFARQAEWVDLKDPGSKFKAYAGDVGAAGKSWSACYDSEKYSQEIEADVALANKVKATGTPTFFINGQRLVGAQPLAAFTELIDGELKK